jgi:propanol-preferring alcohol dehydrogenase
MVLPHYGRQIDPVELDVRPPKGREVLIEVEASAVCASDIYAARGGYSRPAGRFGALKPPLVLGHQIAGRVARVGPGVDDTRVGERCIVYCYLYCGRCRRCFDGRQNLCERVAQRIGFEVPGGFAEFVTVPERNLFKAPQGMSAEEASVLPDAITTSFHAVAARGRVRPQEKALVFGIGALGLYAVRFAAYRGAEVVAVDRVDDERLMWARRFGATDAFAWGAGISPTRTLIDRMRRSLDGPADVVIDLVGSDETLATSVEMLKPHGRLVLVGVAANGRVPLAPLADRKIQVITSLASTPGDLLEVIALAERGDVQPLVAGAFGLHEINEAMRRLERGDAVGRLVVVPERRAS